MKKKTEKIVTIPKLAEMISRSFQNTQDSMNKRFEQMDERFNQVNKEISEVKQGIKTVDKKLGNFIDDYNSEKLPTRVTYLENVLNVNVSKNETKQ